jgi:hypothetical protein
MKDGRKAATKTAGIGKAGTGTETGIGIPEIKSI